MAILDVVSLMQGMARCEEGWPVPGNMVLDGLGQDMAHLIKDRKAKCKVSERMASARKDGPSWVVWARIQPV